MVGRSPERYKASQVMQDLLLNLEAHHGYELQGNQMFIGRLILPKYWTYIPLLSLEFHNLAMGWHRGPLVYFVPTKG